MPSGSSLVLEAGDRKMDSGTTWTEGAIVEGKGASDIFAPRTVRQRECAQTCSFLRTSPHLAASGHVTPTACKFSMALPSNFDADTSDGSAAYIMRKTVPARYVVRDMV